MIYIFDIDGTLIDSSKRHWILLDGLLKKNNLIFPDISEISYINYKRNGNSNKKYLMNVLCIDESVCDSIASEWVRHIEDIELIDTDKLYKDSLKCLERVSTEFNKIIFLSSRNNKENLIYELKKLNVYNFANQVIVSKPFEGYCSKSSYIKSIIYQYPNNEVIVVGDTEVDYFAARENNCKYYMLNRGFRSVDFWKRLNIKTYNSLRSLL